MLHSIHLISSPTLLNHIGIEVCIWLNLDVSASIDVFKSIAFFSHKGHSAHSSGNTGSLVMYIESRGLIRASAIGCSIIEAARRQVHICYIIMYMYMGVLILCSLTQ